MNNHQFDNIQNLIDREAKLEEELFDQDKRPESEEVLEFMESIRELAQSTQKPDDFVRALKLFQKWKVNLLSFYDINYRHRIARSAYDFSLAARYPKGKEIAPFKMEIQKVQKQLRTRNVMTEEQSRDNFDAITQNNKDDLCRLRLQMSYELN